MEQSPLVGDRKPSYGSLARSVEERELSVRAGEIEGDTMLMRNSPIWNKFLFAIACLHTIGTSGVVLGWSALVPLLKQEHLYRDLCPPADDATICPEQENKLNLIYTCGIIGNYFSNVPFGIYPLPHPPPPNPSLLPYQCQNRLVNGQVWTQESKSSRFDIVHLWCRNVDSI